MTQAPPGCFGYGEQQQPFSVSDVARALMKSSLSSGCELDGGLSRRDQLTDLFWTRLEWRQECASCGKFSTAALSDPVVRLPVGQSRDRLSGHLDRFLREQACPCGHLVTGLQPSRARMPKWLMLDLDRRAVARNGESEEVPYGLFVYRILFIAILQVNFFGIIGSVVCFGCLISKTYVDYL